MRKIIRTLFHLLGAEITRYRPDSTADSLFVKSLAAHHINLIFDIGANIGQFGKIIRDSGYKGHIVSFEPVSATHTKLLNISKKDRMWQIAPQMAIGGKNGEITINVSGNSLSSSVLNMLDSHKEAEPDSAYVGSEKVSLKKLDTIAANYLNDSSVLFLKIDTQGYEDQVLNGAADLIKRVAGVQLELSLVPLYENQLLFDDMVKKLNKLGFKLWSLSPVFYDSQDGKLLQLDATFYRS